jgi:4-hydroxy-tetrahydrodipicolinate synthase
MSQSPFYLNAHGGFRGAWPALLTPLDAQLRVDHDRFATHVKDRLAAGCGGVTLFGTTGEGASFSLAERKEALDQLIAHGVPAERIIVSTSCAALPEVSELTRHALGQGVHGCLMLPPFFIKGVSDEGIIRSYAQVIDEIGPRDWRLYLYHIPQVSGVALSHDVIRTLLQRYPQVIAGLKDSGCQRPDSESYARAFMPGTTVYVGNEPDLQTLGRLGSTGAISGLANFYSKCVTRMVLEPDTTQADRDTQRVLELLDIVRPYSLLPALKGIMAFLHKEPAWLRVRAPLVALDAELYARLSARLEAFAFDPARES